MSNSPTISAQRPHAEQDVLFHVDHRIESPAATRNLVGGFYETATRILFGGIPHQIDGRVEVCPDFSIPGRPRSYLEVKSIGQGRQGLIYQKRLENDRRLVASGASLTYVFWIHNVPATTFTSLDELRRALACQVDRVLVIPFARVSKACEGIRPRVMNYRTARSGSHPTKTEMPGYRLPWSLLLTLAGASPAAELRGKVHGHEMVVDAHGPDVAAAMAPLSAEERETANAMLYELSVEQLQVALTPAPEKRHVQQCVRVVLNRNPRWYSRLCAQHPEKRKRDRHDGKTHSDIRRYLVERSLLRLAAGRCHYRYDWLLRPIVARLAAAARQD